MHQRSAKVRSSTRLLGASQRSSRISKKSKSSSLQNPNYKRRWSRTFWRRILWGSSLGDEGDKKLSNKTIFSCLLSPLTNFSAAFSFFRAEEPMFEKVCPAQKKSQLWNSSKIFRKTFSPIRPLPKKIVEREKSGVKVFRRSWSYRRNFHPSRKFRMERKICQDD